MTQLYSIEEISAAQKALKVIGEVPRLIELVQAVGAGPSVEIVGVDLSASTTTRVVTKATRKTAKRPGPRKATRETEFAGPEPKAKPESGKRSRTSKAEVDALKAKVFEQAQKLGSEFSSGELANQLGVERSDVARMLKKLEAEGKIGNNGLPKRAARYHVVK